MNIDSSKSYAEKRLGDRLEEFEKWAFGDDFKDDCPIEEIGGKWNKQHPSLKVKFGDVPQYDPVDMMIDFFNLYANGCKLK